VKGAKRLLKKAHFCILSPSEKINKTKMARKHLKKSATAVKHANYTTGCLK